MKFILAIANIVALGSMFSAHAERTCYGPGYLGDSWEMSWHSQRACEGYFGEKGAFQGVFQPNELRRPCVDTSSILQRSHINMDVQNQNGAQAFDLLDTDCTKEFADIINYCGQVGGWSKVEGWYFRIDPNEGGC
ncbi:hypothetical protein DM02DRAFT_659316 [Periconia macrospinosa]|uniref:Secreted protein n=1 Tax=Periconia macrospinosa TaxID=97972 RepID=A0A2V1DE99_9PLEO|nr:hypothetical protein DM02DRAFT_659316 [Periconia macrospinosa]